MAPPDELDPRLDRLFEVPLESFVAERDALVKALRAEGDRALAREATAMKRPTAAAWMLDQLVRSGESVALDALAAAERLGAAQTAALDGDRSGLQAAMSAYRTAVEQLLGHVRRKLRPGGKAPTQAALEHLRELVLATAGDPDLAAIARAGRLVEDPEPADPFGLGVAPPAEEAVPRSRRETAPDRGKDRAPAEPRGKERAPAGPRGKERPTAEARRREEREAAEARRREEREAAEARRREEREAAEAALDEAARAVAARRRDARAADDTLSAARAALDQAKSAAQDAEAAAAEARDALAAAEGALRDREKALAALNRPGRR
jgi:hypothetical protein